MKNDYKAALKSMPDGCDIHDGTDWFIHYASTIQSALEKAQKYDRLLERLQSGEVSESMLKAFHAKDSPAEDYDAWYEWDGFSYKNAFKVMTAQMMKEIDDE